MQLVPIAEDGSGDLPVPVPALAGEISAAMSSWPGMAARALAEEGGSTAILRKPGFEVDWAVSHPNDGKSGIAADLARPWRPAAPSDHRCG